MPLSGARRGEGTLAGEHATARRKPDAPRALALLDGEDGLAIVAYHRRLRSLAPLRHEIPESQCR